MFRWMLLLAGMIWLGASAPQAQSQAPGSGVPEDGGTRTPNQTYTPNSPNNFIVGPATQPTPAIRPDSFPGGPAGKVGPAAPAWVPPLGAGRAEFLKSAIKVVQVGSEIVLDSDMMGGYGRMMEAKEKGASADELKAMREVLATQYKGEIDLKLLFLDATTTIPPDGQKEIEQKINEQFAKTKLKELLEQTHLNSPAELDAKLHEFGTSLERRRRAFYEQTLARYWLQQQVEVKDIDAATIYGYYTQNIEKFKFPARARWEEMMVQYDKFQNPAAGFQAVAQIGTHYASKADARRALGEMGDAVLRGVPFGDVAKARSQGLTADKGGQRDWTTKGALLSSILDEAIFGLPVGKMSQILEDDDKLYIIRVIERREAGKTPLRDAQPEIMKQLKDERAKKQTEEYLEKLRAKTPAWTILDADR